MKKIWLLLTVFLLAAGLFAATFVDSGSSALAKSSAQTAQATPTPQGEEAANEESDTEEATNTEAITGTEEITGTEGITDTGEITDTEGMAGPLVATAELQDVDGNIVGTALFTQTMEIGAVDISVEISGLMVITPGAHGIHVHQVGRCTPDFAVAGEHFNPAMAEHGLENPEGPHNGDLPAIEIDAEGNATYAATSTLFTLSDGPRSLLAADGSALLIHEAPDDQISDPSGKSGARIACGVLTAADVPAAEEPTPPPPVEGSLLQPEQRSATLARVAQLQIAEGFTITTFAKGLGNVRMMAEDDNGILYVTRPAQGDVLALIDADGDGVADGPPVLATAELTLVHGIVITGDRVYLATPTIIWVGDVVGDGTLTGFTPLVGNLPGAGQHPRPTMNFGPDGLLYVSVGSSCNDCLENDPERAAILQVQLDGSTRTIFASGLRNTLGFGWHPVTQEMWGMDQGSDWRGNDHPDEELNLIEEGNNYGWPFCFNDKEINQYIPLEPVGPTKAEFCEESTAATLLYQAHSSPIGMVFYTGEQFPEEYQNNAFVAMRGSWNRNPATGYKVVRILFDEEGQPVAFEDFVTGFLIEDGMAHFGRVAGLLVREDGSMLISEDTNGMIYRVSYTAGEE